MYLKITNPGICHPAAFTVLGVSTARGDSNKIGQFGSGFKMGINTCLRFGINPIIASGNSTITFDCVQKLMGDKPYNQVLAIVDGQKQELGFCTEFGAIDWDKIDYAVREFVSNAYDQGGCNLSIVDKVDHSVDSTSVYVEYSADVQRYHENIKTYFMDQKLAKISCVLDNNSDKLLVYRKGVLVHEQPKKSLFSYNINDIRVDESRNVDSWLASYRCAMMIDKCSNEQLDRLTMAIVDGEDYAEVGLDYDYFPAEKLADSFKRVYPRMKVCTKDIYRFCKNKNNVINVSLKAYKLFARSLDIIAEVEGGIRGATNGYMPTEISADCKRIFNRVWNKVVKLGLHNGKVKPGLAMYAKPMDSGCQVGGYYEDDTVYIERNSVNAKVILEEIGHYVTGASDCTRDFQDWAFNVAGALL